MRRSRTTLALAVLLILSAVAGYMPPLVGARPALAATPDLAVPFGPGPAWQIIQGYDTTHTHGGSFKDERYAFDLTLVEKDAKGEYIQKPDATEKQSVLAMADGTVAWTDAPTGCLALRHDAFTEEIPDPAASGGRSRRFLFSVYCHLQGAIGDKMFDLTGQQIIGGQRKFSRGDPINLAGHTGVAPPNPPHIHVHLFTTVNHPHGDAGHRTPVRLDGLRASVLLNGDKQTAGPKTTWPDIGGQNQYRGWVISAPDGAPPVQRPVASSTVFVVDVSSSMQDADSSGTAKIAAARESVRRVSAMLDAENGRGSEHQAGLVSFGNQAQTLLTLTRDVANLGPIADRLQPNGNTNLADGLRQGAGLLPAASAARQRLLVLLSDGVPNIDARGRQAGSPAEIQAIEREVVEQVWPSISGSVDCLYVIGLGNPAVSNNSVPSIDEPFLRQLGSLTMCGSYARAGNIVELTNAYVRLRHESTGMILGAFDGRIRLGETTEPRTFQVPDGQQELHVTLNWPGSALDLLLTDPTGKIVDAAYAGAQVFRDRLPVYVIVRDPRPGTWQFRVRGVDVPSLGTVYSVVASVRALPPGLSATGGLGLAGLILLVGLMVSVALLGWVAARHQRSGGGRPLGYLDPKRVPGGPPSAHIPITRLPFTIGRDASCQLVLADAGVSRYHARIVRVGQGLVIEDLGSHNGIFVNRRRVARARLDPATEIRLGRTELQFVPPQQQAAPPHRLQAPGRVR